MNTLSMPETSFEAPWVGCPQADAGRASSELVKTFGNRVFSIARHITQNDEDAENVLIETFLEVCHDSAKCEDEETLWLRLVTIAVRKAFLGLAVRAGLRPGQIDDSSESLVLRELFVWGDDYQERYSRKQMSHVLENGLRSLDPMARTVFVLRDIEQIPVERIPGIVNRSAAAVAVCILRARLQLREALAPQMRQCM